MNRGMKALAVLGALVLVDFAPVWYKLTHCHARSDIMTSSAKGANIMNQSTIRTIFRWIHIVLAIPIIGYIYSPFDQIPNYARPTRFIFVPVLILSGLCMWKGHVLRRLVSKRSPSTTGMKTGRELEA
jgi:hypothetical protein